MRILSFLFLITLIAAVEYFIGWRVLLQPWQQVSLPILTAAAALVFASYALRALRLYDYFRPVTHGRYPTCLRLMLWHNFYNNLLPMRSGELSFPILMQRYFQIPAAHAVGALLWFRVLDLHTIGTLALVALTGAWLPLPAVIGLLLPWSSLPWLVFHLQKKLLPWLEPHVPARFQTHFSRLRAGLPQTPGVFLRAWGWTVINWLIKLGVFAWVLTVFIEIPAAAAWLGAIGGDLTSVLPVHGFAGAGTYEAGVAAALLPFGIPPRDALQAAVNLHLFLLGLSVASGGVAWMWGGMVSSEVKTDGS